MTEIITGLLAKISDGDQVRTYLLTTGAYHDPALASQIEFGTALPVIPRDAGLSIREQIMFQPQGGTSGINISNIPLINSEGDFDDWGGWYLSGLEQVIKRGYADQAWADWTDLVVGVGKGKPEFIGRERVIVSVRDSFAYMSQPVANQVFDDTVGNERLENVTVPMVFGAAYQVPALLAEPEILEYAVATNANDIPSVQEGGNPSDPQFVFVPNGFQLFASPTLKITCDVTGPPLAEHDTSDALANIGAFDNWTSGYPDGWTVREDSPYSVINEDSSGDAAIEATAQIDGDTGWVNADAWEAPENLRDEQKFEPVGGTLVEVLEADDGTYASVTAPAGYRKYELKGSQFPFGLSDTTAPVELDVRITAENNGGGSLRLNKLYLRLPDGTTRNLKGTDFPVITTKETLEYTFDNKLADGYKFTNDILEDPDTDLVIEIFRDSNSPSGSTDFRIHEVALKVHYGPIIDRLRLTTENDVLTVGNRYQLIIRTRGGSGDSIKGFWGGVDSDTSEISGIDDPYAQTTSQLEAEDDFEFSFIAQGKKFAIEFDRGDGNGEQILERLELLDQSGHQERFSELVQYIHEQAGKTPEDVCDVDALDDLQTKAENPRLGWWVKNETTREQLCILFAQSLGGATWGGLDGKWTAAQMRIPQQPSGDYLEITGSFDPGHANADPGKGLTDRVWAAKNWHPIPEDSTAGVTTTWTEADRQRVVADWRITEKADFSNLDGFSPGVTIESISPEEGTESGDTDVEITGFGFSGADFNGADTVTIGGSALVNPTVVSDTKITGQTPAGTNGRADVVVTIGEDSATLTDGFDYIWTPAEITTALWLDAADADTITLDGSGNVTQWNDKSGNDRHLLDISSSLRPEYTKEHQNGRNVVTLNDSSMDWSATSLTADDWQLFIAHEQTSVSKSSALGYFMDSTTDRFIVASHYDSSSPYGNAAFYDGAWTSMAATTSGGQILHYELDADARLLRDGSEVATPGGYSQKPIGGTVKWFSRNDSASDFATGRVWEIVLVKGSISESDRQKLEGYLAHRWGTESELEAGHPYKDSRP